VCQPEPGHEAGCGKDGNRHEHRPERCEQGSGAAGVPAVGRLEEVARRIMLSGPHSKAARMQALKLADVSPEGKAP